MADTLPLDGSNSLKTKIKGPTNTMPLSKSNATATGICCVDNPKTKKNVKSDKLNKSSMNKESNASAPPSSVLKSAASTNSYQVNLKFCIDLFSC